MSIIFSVIKKISFVCSAVFLAACICITPGKSFAYDLHWNVSGPADWATDINWDSNNVPTSSDTAYIMNNGTATLSTSAPQVTSLFVGLSDGSGNDGALTIDNYGALTVSDYTEIGTGKTGTVTINNGGVLTTRWLNLGNGTGGNGILDINGGSVTVDYANLIEIGASSGAGMLMLQNGGMLEASGIINGGGGSLDLQDGVIKYSGDGTGTFFNGFTTPITLGGALTFETGVSANIDNILAGTGSLTKSGAGTLTLSGANTYSGGTIVNAGTLVGDTNSLQGDITNSSEVEFNQTGTGTYAGAMAGIGNLIKTGAGTLILSGSNTYVGATAINDGILSLMNANAASSSADFRTSSAGTLVLDFPGLFGQTVIGSGNLTVNPGSGNTLTLEGTHGYTGMTTVQSGILTLGDDLDYSSHLTLLDGTAFNQNGQVHTLDNGSLTVHGSATYIGDLSAQNAQLNFYIPDTASAGDTMLTVNGDADISNSTISAGIEGSNPLPDGLNVNLLSATGALTTSGIIKGTALQGVTMLYDFNLTPGSNTNSLQTALVTTDPTPPVVEPPVVEPPIVEPPVVEPPIVEPPVVEPPVVEPPIVEPPVINPPVVEPPVIEPPIVEPPVDPIRVNPQTKALVEGYLAGVALVNLGADVAAGQGMDAAVNAVGGALSSGRGLNTFGALSGGWSRYKTGSHVDMSSISLLAGLAAGADLKPGRLTLGVFFEYGNGSYNTHNSFSSMNSVKGDGDMDYVGGGILGRFEFKGSASGHAYVEASGRAGRVHNDYASGDLRDAWGRKAKYEDSSAAYYGLHGGAGYVFNLSDKATLDFYGKYFWTHQEGDSERLSTGDSVSFSGINSKRARVGTRVSYAISEKLTPYVGAAVEREFDGKAKASTKGFALDAPSLKGNTGIGEIGLSYKPSATLPLTFELGAQGYVGKREGVTGSLQAKWEF